MKGLPTPVPDLSAEEVRAISAMYRCLSDALWAVQNSRADRFEFGWEHDGLALVRTNLFAARLLYAVLGSETQAYLKRVCPALFHGRQICAFRVDQLRTVTRQVRKLSMLADEDLVEELGQSF